MDLAKLIVAPEDTVRTAIEKIDEGEKKVVFVVDGQQKLIGLFTDGDMRRYMLKRGDLTAAVKLAMNANPLAFLEEQEQEARELLERDKLIVMPIVDRQQRLVSALFWNDGVNMQEERRFPDGMPVIIMAGGEGKRLYPYTKILPKPLIPIGDYTITEHIIRRFQRYGAEDFFMILNHKKNMIKAYFNDLERDYRMHFIEEDGFLGTGGGLSLLKGKIHSTAIVSNCDILLESDYVSMYDYHKNAKNVITIICAMKNITIPYGVIDLDRNGRISGMREKPKFSFLTNTGVYLIEPEVIEDLEENVYIDLPTIAEKYIEKGRSVGAYPVTEKSWMDMGQMEEMKSMMKTLGID